MQPRKKSTALDEFEKVSKALPRASPLGAGQPTALHRFLELVLVADEIGRRVVANENVHDEVHGEDAVAVPLHGRCDVAVEGEPTIGVTGLDQIASQIRRHIDLEPAVSESVVPQDHAVVDRLGDRDFAVESKDSCVGRVEDPDRLLVGVEVVIGQHADIMHQR